MEKKEVIIKTDQPLNGVGRSLLESFNEMIRTNGYTRYIFEKLKCFSLLKQRDKDAREAIVTLLNFGRVVDIDEIITEMTEGRFHPLSTGIFLIFGKQHHTIWTSSPVITLSSVWKKEGELFVPCYWKESEKFPDMFWLNEPWGINCWFAASKS